MFKKTIISEFFTTVSFNQFIRSLYLSTFGIFSLRYGKDIEFVENEFLMYLGQEKSKILSLYNGRSALYQALKIAGVKKTDEVIVSSYTCVSVINSIIQSGGQIVYCDIEKKNLGLEPKDLSKKITKNTKVIIIQHTFGKAANIKEISKIAKEKSILIIEDCAHSLGSKLDKKKLGGFGDFSIFSTGRDKVISSVSGGFLIVNNQDYFKQTDKIKKKLKTPSRKRVLKDLMYNIFAYKAYKLYDFFSLGKGIIYLSRKINIINEIMSKDERNCKFKNLYFTLPNSLAFLVSKELEKIKLYSHHRRLISDFYSSNINNPAIEILYKTLKNEKNNAFRFPILIKTEKLKNKLYSYMKQNNILLGNYWSGDNLVPLQINKKNTLYEEGSCKVAEDVSKRILTLPNHTLVSLNDAEKVINLINKFNK